MQLFHIFSKTTNVCYRQQSLFCDKSSRPRQPIGSLWDKQQMLHQLLEYPSSGCSRC